MTRIIAGVAKGRRLSVPPGARPTTDRVRESMFSVLDHHFDGLAGLRVLDLFAGSGALGLEAASRGAQEVVLVESDARAAAVARQNVKSVGLPMVRVVGATVAGYLAGASEEFDLVFADPPYEMPLPKLARQIGQLAQGWLSADALIVVERSSHDPDLEWATGIVALRKSAFGTTTLWYGQAVPAGEDS